MEKTMEEEWKTIRDYPAYEVSNMGFVRRIGSNRVLQPKKAKGNSWFVKLSIDGDQVSKTIKILVAEAFVPKPQHYQGELFDTPVQRVMNTDDLRAEKIVWRPRWFAVKFRRDLRPSAHPYYFDVPVRNINTGKRHASILTASLEDCVLMEDVYRSCLEERRVFPEWHRYEFIPREEIEEWSTYWKGV
jgi:hypothetical protein